MASLSNATYYSQTAAGAMFTGSTAVAGVLIPISTTTSPTFGLWNPQNSGKYAVLVRYTASFVSTTGAPGGILYSALTGAGSAPATGAPITVFNQVAPTNGLISLGLGSVMKFTPAGTNTLTTAGTVYATSGNQQLTTTGATTSAPFYSVFDDFNGRIIVPPGVFFYTTGSAALLSLFDQTLQWYETATL